MRKLTMRVALVCGLAVMGAVPTLAQVPERCAMPVAQVLSPKGSVEIQFGTPGVQSVAVASRDAFLCPGDSLRTGPDGTASFRFLNGGQSSVGPNSILELREPTGEGRSLMDLLRGILYFFGRLPTSLDVATPFVTAGVEGTEFVLEVGPDRAVVTVFEGLVRMANPQGTLLLSAGQSGEALEGQAPELRIVVRPRDAVQWAVHYPPASTQFIDRSDAAPALDQALAESEAALRAGSLREALDRLDQIPPGDRNERFYVFRAGLRLGVGLVEEARSDLDQAVMLAPDDGEAYGLRAIIAVAQNDPEQALESGRQAVALSPNSSPARVALSYAQQANYDLEGARDSLMQAVENEPDDSMAWARLAEIWLSLGYLDRALEAAETANSVGPELARTHTVLGFARLSQIRLSEATTAFERAIELDSEDSLPRLGLGLTRIRGGDLEAGREDIETAVVLDPNNATIRSYLGKAYFEERRDDLAAGEFEIAKGLDPNDPTAYFYDAIRKQTVNRPVEALRDLQRSIELNDSRAVYRSRFLLDEDLGARGTSLGRIYHDLGFDQLALLEGTRSLVLDPANYSAHRFLADSYASQPRHEIARASELLRAQLLQPVNINPLQPQLAETDLNIVSRVGPGQATFNEFTRLFERDGLQFTGSGLGGENETWGDELVIAGIEGRLSYSVGQFHYQDEGFRENNDLQHDIYNLFAQAQLTSRFSMQGEYRRRNTEQGDLSLHFDPNDFSTSLRTNLTRDTVRLGVRVDSSPRSTLLGSLIYSKGSQDGGLVEFDVALEDETETEGYDGQAQYMFSSDLVSVTAGGGVYDIEVEGQSRVDYTAIFGVPCPFPTCEASRDSTIKQYNSYIYSSWNMFPAMTWTIGIAYDSFEQAPFEPEVWSPKVGLSWQFSPGVRLRLAYSKGLTRTLIVDQTLEPTQIAGFNQFYDDLSGTRAERYGAGIDAKLSDGVYGGFELSRRDIVVPLRVIMAGAPDFVLFEDQREDRRSGYLYWALRTDYALTAEYQFERFRSREAERLPRTSFAETTMVPLGARYFHPRGLFAEIKLSYVRQEVERLDPMELAERDREEFVLLDAAVGYRLPSRRGILSLGVDNLMDHDFRFEEINIQTQEPGYPRFLPARTIRLGFTITF